MPVATVKVEHVNPFLKATRETFATMIGIEVKPGKPSLKQGSGVNYDVSGIIGLSGKAKGSIALSFPRESAIQIVSQFIGEPLKDLNDDVVDAIGELANIVAGCAKKELVEFNVQISLPTVILGAHHQVKDPKDVLSMVIPFSSTLGTFDLAVSLKSED